MLAIMQNGLVPTTVAHTIISRSFRHVMEVRGDKIVDGILVPFPEEIQAQYESRTYLEDVPVCTHWSTYMYIVRTSLCLRTLIVKKTWRAGQDSELMEQNR